MSEDVDELLEAVGLEDGSVPPDEALYGLSGLSRADTLELASRWDAQPVELVRDTITRMREVASSDRAIEFDELFAHFLSHDDADIRECAVTGLTGNGDSRLVETFTDMLRNDPAESVREKSAMALGAYADFADTGRLTQQRLDRLNATLTDATGEESVRVAGAALVAQARMPGDARTEVIEAWCDRGAKDVAIMSYAVAAMGSSGERHWFPDIIAAMDHPSARVRESATLAFGELANPDDDMEFMETLLDDESLEVQMAAVTALRMVGTDEARGMLVATIRTNPEPSVREGADSALRQLKNEDDLRHAVSPEMEAQGLYGGGGTELERDRDIGRYDAPTEEGWGLVPGEDDDGDDEYDDEDEEGAEDEEELDEDIGEDMEDWYESEEYWRDME